MDRMNFQIAYLLAKHECVIIPAFGAFIVSENRHSSRSSRNVLTPPSRFLTFNSEITHNDGLLANSVAREKNIGFSEAMNYVREYADRLRTALEAREQVQIPWVGRLWMSPEWKILFTPAPNLSCNADVYGFTGVRLPMLSELEQTQQQQSTTSFKRRKKKNGVIWLPFSRRIAIYSAAAAAAAIMIFVPSSINNDAKQSFQSRPASFVPFPAKTINNEELTTNNEELTINNEGAKNEVERKKEEIVVSDTQNDLRSSEKRYFIIVSSLPTREIAESELPKFHKKGFADAFVRSDGNKHRIAVAGFSDFKEAEKSLREFRAQHSDNAKAWLLKE